MSKSIDYSCAHYEFGARCLIRNDAIVERQNANASIPVQESKRGRLPVRGAVLIVY